MAENNRRGFGFSGINARKTHCAQGHAFTPENTARRYDHGGRECRACRRATTARRLARKQLEVA